MAPSAVTRCIGNFQAKTEDCDLSGPWCKADGRQACKCKESRHALMNRAAAPGSGRCWANVNRQAARSWPAGRHACPMERPSPELAAAYRGRSGPSSPSRCRRRAVSAGSPRCARCEQGRGGPGNRQPGGGSGSVTCRWHPATANRRQPPFDGAAGIRVWDAGSRWSEAQAATKLVTRFATSAGFSISAKCPHALTTVIVALRSALT